MKTFAVFQQKYPKKVEGGPTETWETRLKEIGTVMANTGAEAIDAAKERFLCFKIASRSTLGAFPIVVEEVKCD